MWLPDGTTPAPASVITGADGRYAFPAVAPSTYQLVVTPPGGYVFPSKLPPALQPAGRFLDPRGSYGNSFTVSGTQSAPVRFDLPLDPGATSGGLLIDKTAGRITAQVGDFIDYSVKLNNASGAALANTLVNDSLPAGFVYVSGSARLNGTPLADPAGGGPVLRFNLGVLAKAAQATLTYRVRVGVGAQGTTGINTAQAVSGSVLSNRANAAVQIVGGVFAPEAYLIGKVYADCNANGVQDPGEPGVPGVRIYLEDGTYAVTDEQGKYSLYGLVPRLHVAKADPTTLPAGVRLEVLNNRNALDAGSQFVDLTEGELHKADFALAACSASLREEIAARRKALAHPSEILQAAGSLWPANAATQAVDAHTLPSSGVIRLPGQSQSAAGAAPAVPQVASAMPGIAPFATAAVLGAVTDPGGPYAPQAQGLPQPLNTPTEKLLQEQSTPAPAAAPDESDFADFKALRRTLRAEALEKLLPQMDPQVGFVGLSDTEVLAINQATVRVKGPLGAHFELSVNGQRIAETQVGKKSSLQQTGVVAWEYIGVDLKPGRNALDVRALDDFGIVRGSAQITVLAPGPLDRIVIEAPARMVADAATPVPITVLLHDADGLPVAAPTPITLSSSLGQWQFPGEAQGPLAHTSPEQHFVTGGVAHLLLLPPAQPGKAELSVSSGMVKTTTTLEFTPQLRPMLGVGLISGTLNLRNLNPSALQPAHSADVFEREIESVSRSFDGGKGAVAARTALFLKGKVLGSTLLTLAYDSDKPSDTTLFRDIQPDRFYPVYGDSSARGFDAQSTGKLYVMVQNGTNYALYGDYATQSDNPARQLTQYARALNGAKGHWQLGTVTVDGFASETSTTQSVVEFRANGTSGPFQLDLRGVTNSQQVDLITRDRNQSAIILNDTPLTPFTDYAIEPYSGLLLLKNPVASVDANLNPVYVRVSYSVDAGGPKHWVEGADARLPLSPAFTLGATAIHDADPANELTLQGVNLTGKLGEHTTGTAEVARSNTDLQGEATLQAHVWGVRTEADFYNPNSLQSAGASQYGVKAAYRLEEKDRIVAEALKTSNSTTGAEQTGAELKVEHSLPGNAKLEAGLRHSRANAESALSAPALPGTSTPVVPAVPAAPSASAQVGYTSARAKLTVPVPEVKGAEIFGLAEQAIDGSGGREDALGGTYAVNATTRIYAQHDFINSLNGPYTLNSSVSRYSTVAGISSTLPDTTQLFNEYRVGDGLDGRSSEAAVGLRRLWKLSDGIGVSASMQRIAPLSGVVTDASNAVSLGADYTAARDWKASTQAQWQTSANSHSWLFTAGMARKLDADWTLLNRALYSQQTELAAGGGRELARVQSGFAYRPVDSDVWNALGQIEYKRDFDTTLGPGLSLDEQAWILAGNLNVQPSRGWQISGRYAAKRGIDWSGGLASHSFTELAGARSLWDVTACWDAGVQGYRMWGDGARQYAVGVELGYLVWKNLRLSLGYNVKGLHAARRVSASELQVRREPVRGQSARRASARRPRRRRPTAMTASGALARSARRAVAGGWAARLLLAALLAPWCVPAFAVSGSYASNGTFAQSLWWLDFTGFSTASTSAQALTFTLPNGAGTLGVSAQISSTAMQLVAEPAWTGGGTFGHGAYNGIGGTPIFYWLNQVGTATTTLSGLSVKDGSGNVRSFVLYAADGENTNNVETNTYNSTASWRLIDTVNYYALFNGGVPTLTGTGTASVLESAPPVLNDKNYNASVVLGTTSPSQVSTTYSGNQGTLFALSLPPITFNLVINGRVSASDQFTAAIAYTSPAASIRSVSTSGAATTAGTGATSVIGTNSITLSAAMDAGSFSPLSTYTGSMACSNSGPGAAAFGGTNTVLPSGAGTSFALTPQTGDNITCPLTLTPPPQTVSGTVYNDANHNRDRPRGERTVRQAHTLLRRRLSESGQRGSPRQRRHGHLQPCRRGGG